MKTLGVIGGIAPASTIEYYRMLFATYQARLPDGSAPPVIINSIDMQTMLRLIAADALGTRFTMQGTAYPQVFTPRGITIVPPDSDDLEYVHTKYMTELVKAEFLPGTRTGLLAVVRRLRDRHEVDGIILGGTELPLILRDVSGEGIPFLDTGRIHVESAVDAMLA